MPSLSPTPRAGRCQELAGRPTTSSGDVDIELGNVGAFWGRQWTGKRRSNARQHDPPSHRNDVERRLDDFSSRQDTKVAKARMLANGWCFHRIEYFARTYPLATFVYMSKFERSHSRQEDHQRCRHEPECVAFNVDLSNYQPRHTSDGCKCVMVATPYQELIDTIRAGDIPLISIAVSEGDESSRKLCVHRRRQGLRYAALSHVWADGFGNPHENALPLCQIKRLEVTLNALKDVSPRSSASMGITLNELETLSPRSRSQKGALFWVDTLCIPVGQNDRLHRAEQIDKLASIYKGAETGLVWDAELMSLNYTQMSPNEMCAWIACSAWMSRSWTFQEGQLPLSLTIVFKDALLVVSASACEVTAVIDDSVRGRADSISAEGSKPQAGPTTQEDTKSRASTVSQGNSLSQQCMLDGKFLHSMMTKVWKPLWSPFRQNHSFVSVWNELAARSTSKPEDLPLIIANIMNFDNRPLLMLQSFEEMIEALCCSLPSIPISLFLIPGKRLVREDKPESRWVPAEVVQPLGFDNMCLRESNGFTFVSNSQEATSDTWVYVHKARMPLRSGLQLYFEDTDKCYTAKVSQSDGPHINLDHPEDVSTYLMVSKTFLRPGVRRAACFYTPRYDRHEAPSVGHRVGMPPRTELIYCAPVELWRSRPEDDSGLAFSAITEQHHFHIQYQISPALVELCKRSAVEARYYKRVAILGGASASALSIGLAVKFAMQRKLGLIIVTSLATAMVLLTMILLAISIYVKRKALARRTYNSVRSLEDIAERRRVEGQDQ